MTQPGIRTYIRDTLTYVGGWMLILKQAGIFFDPPSQPSEALIWAGIALISGTGLAQLVGLRFGTGSVGESPRSPERPEQSSSPSGGK